VIGAGIAGLVTAKVLREDGFDVTVFEKQAEPGGVWIESRTYPGLRANNSRDTYAFSDHPYPKTADRFPTAPQIRDYLRSYVARFDLAPAIRASAEVTRVARAGAGFELEVSTADKSESLAFDFVAVCAGVFSEPQVPEIEPSASPASCSTRARRTTRHWSRTGAWSSSAAGSRRSTAPRSRPHAHASACLSAGPRTTWDRASSSARTSPATGWR
jgi:2-polyprenyl-6-methoxyphenol hydroxylase-like FAD-dependent oxidoreductase